MSIMAILGWSSVGLGAALAVTGIALGGLASKARSKVVDAEEGTDWLTLRSAYKSYDGYVAGAGVCVGLGVAAAAAGATLLILDRKKSREKEKVNVTPTVTPDGAMVVVGGRF
jgi:hypothetical protein